AGNRLSSYDTPAMAVLELSARTWEEVRDLDRAKAVAILPTGALEAHGPHLPLGTDVIIAEAMARRAAEKLSARGYHAVLLPPLEYTAAEFAAAFPGTVSLRPSTVTALVVDVASSLGRHGFPVLAIANAHLDPAHVASIEAELGRAHVRPPVTWPPPMRACARKKRGERKNTRLIFSPLATTSDLRRPYLRYPPHVRSPPRRHAAAPTPAANPAPALRHPPPHPHPP